MKALISPKQVRTESFIHGWELVDGEHKKQLTYIEGCVRVAQVVAGTAVFDVAYPLFWVDAPDDCTTGQWYYKDGSLHKMPDCVPQPGAEE